MGRIPARFERVAAAFDADMARVRLCESSGSEHSPAISTDLSDLVKSFMEKNERAGGSEFDDEGEEFDNSEKREILQEIFDEDGDEGAKEKIREEAQIAMELVEDMPSPEFKRLFISRLRDRGFDAGLCKSKWDKNRRFPGGDYEYIDVNFAGSRYIVEFSLVAQFEIARPTNQYSSLLDVFPPIFVGKVEELKRVVRLMCTAIKDSMKSMDLHIPPWRRNGYMQAKWFSSYKRTTNKVATRKALLSLPLGDFTNTRSIGFEARPVKSYNCRDDYGNKTAFRVGYLTAAFDAIDLRM